MKIKTLTITINLNNLNHLKCAALFLAAEQMKNNLKMHRGKAHRTHPVRGMWVKTWLISMPHKNKMAAARNNLFMIYSMMNTAHNDIYACDAGVMKS